MANYNLVVDSKFEPFSFERYIQPYQLYDKAYKEVEKDYTDYVNKVGVWENLINQETEAEAYNQYKTYMNALEDNAKLLMQEGLNPTQRDRLLGMKSRYSKEIIPIEQAYAKRAEQIKAQQDLRAKDPSVLLEGEASITSLDDYIKNPQLTYKTHSGAVLEQTASKAAGNLARELTTNPRKWQSILGNSYYETIMQHGLTSEDILNFMKNPEASKELDNIYNSVLESSGITNWSNYEDIKDEVDDYITRGFWSAIGTTSFDRLANPFLKDGSGEKEDVSSPLSISYITTGNSKTDPEFEAIQENLKGIRPTDSIIGYTTETIDNLYKQYKEATQQLQNLGTEEELQRLAEIERKSKAAGVGVVPIFNLTSNRPSAKKQNMYRVLKNDIKKIKDKLNQQIKQQEVLAKDWEHLGNNKYERLQRWLQLKQSQNQQQERTVTFNAESADHKKVLDGVDTIVRSFTKRDIESGNIGLFKVNTEGELDSVNYDNTKKILEGPHEIVVRLTNNPHLAIIADGEEYEIKGSNIISNANTTLKVTNEFLSDFSKNGLKQFVGENTSISDINVITPEELQVLQPGIIMPSNHLKSIKGGYKGAAFRINGTNEYIKILTDASGRIIATNTTVDEIEGMGTNRINVLLGIAKNINKNYINKVSVDYDDHK